METNPNGWPLLTLRIESYTRLSADERARIQSLTRKNVRDIGPRRDLLREGDNPKGIFLVVDGWACRYKQLPDGRRQIVGLFIPGDICDMSIYILKEMDHSIGAITKLRVAEIGADEFEQLMRESQRVTQALHWDELVTVAIQREWTLNLGQRTAFERLAHLFLELYVRLQAVGLAQDGQCDFPLTQGDLAEATGLTSVHVNRTLQELRRQELIELQGRRLTILDMEALKRAAMFNDNYLHLQHEGAHLDAND